MFNNQNESTKSMKGIKGFAKRALVIFMSFMMAIQVIPFSMYGIEGVTSHAAEGQLSMNIFGPYDASGNTLKGKTLYYKNKDSIGEFTYDGDKYCSWNNPRLWYDGSRQYKLSDDGYSIVNEGNSACKIEFFSDSDCTKPIKINGIYQVANANVFTETITVDSENFVTDYIDLYFGSPAVLIVFNINWLEKPTDTPEYIYSGESQGPSGLAGCTVTDNSQTNPGTYTATFTPNEGYYWTDFTQTAVLQDWKIVNANSLVSTTPEITTSTLTYTGSAQNLLSKAGAATNGTLQYAVTTSNSTTAPTSGWGTTYSATNAGTYYVWYYSKGNTYYNDTTKTKLGSITVNRKELTASFAAQTYTGSALTPDPTFTGLVTGENLAKGTDYTVSYTNNTNAGNASATITWDKTDKAKNYSLATTAYTFKINKATATKTNPVLKTSPLPYNGGNQEILSTVGSSSHGTYYYYISKTNSAPSLSNVTSTTHTVKDAGTYYVWYKFTGDSNHNDVEVTSLGSITVNRKELTASFAAQTYTGSALTPDPTFTGLVTGENLAKGTDYTVSYTNNTNAGNASATITWDKSDKSKNYSLSTLTGYTFTISKATNPIQTPGDKTWSITSSTGGEYTLPVCPNIQGDPVYTKTSGDDNFTVSGDKLLMNANTPVGTYAIQIKAETAGNDNYVAGETSFKVTVTVTDDISPTAKIVGSTSDVADHQTVTFAGMDNVGITKYYFGKKGNNADIENAEWKTWSDGTNSENVSADGTYFLFTKDAIGNVSSSDSIKFYETKLETTLGSVALNRIITASGDSITSLPAITPYEGCTIPRPVWKVGGEVAASIEDMGEFKPTSSITLKAVCEDTTDPVTNIAAHTKNVAPTQDITLKASDNVGITAYYFGMSADGVPTSSDADELAALTGEGLTKHINKKGTYYLVTRDAAGNKTSDNITFFETKLGVTHGTIEPNTILTASGDAIEHLPAISADSEGGYYVQSDPIWKVGNADEATIVDKGEYTPTGDKTLTAVCADNGKPTAVITSTSDVANYQTVSFFGTDNEGIKKYYFGPQQYGICDETWTGSNTDTVTAPGTYYLITKDEAGNESIPTPITFYETTLMAFSGKLSTETEKSKDSVTVLTRAGDSFALPLLEPDPEYAELDTEAWSVNDTDDMFDKGEIYTPDGNHTLVNTAVGDLGIVATSITAEANGLPHAALIRARVAGARVSYGFTEECTDGNINSLPGDNVDTEMKHAALTEIGTKTVWYIASKPGYKTVKGYVTITVIDSSDKPTAAIQDLTHKAKPTQTVTLTAFDIGKIEKWYFGTEKTPNDNEFETINTPLAHFERRGVEVSASGTNYFIVKDMKGDSATAKIEMRMVEINPVNGTPSVPKMLVQAGAANELPIMKEHEGYKPLTSWRFLTLEDPEEEDDGELPITEDITVHPGETLTVQTSGVLTGICEEMTATLSFDNNGRGATQDAVTMYYSKEATASAMDLSADGYNFLGWNTKADGTGDTYKKGDVVKRENVIPQNTTLYAKWEAKKVVFENQEFTRTTSNDAQTVEISGASNGTGDYEYTLVSQTNGEHFSVNSADGTITIAEKTPAKKYTVLVKATDTETHENTTATFTFIINRMNGALSLASEDAELITFETKEIGIDCTSDAILAASSNNPAVIASISSDSLIIESTDKTCENVVITVTAPQTEIYTAAQDEITVTVKNRTFRVTPTDVTVSADGQAHAAKISSEFGDVDVKYGLSPDKLIHTLHIASADEDVELVDESLTEVGSKKVYYVASKVGYGDETGDATITITDEIDATGYISNSSKELADHQTVTLTASDNSKIKGFYFGKKTLDTCEMIPLTEPVQNFKRDKVAVASGEGTYNFIVEDMGGHKTTVDTLEFYNTNFEVENCTTTVSTTTPVLIASGDGFNMPAITPAYGYDLDGVQWIASSDGTKLSADAYYEPHKTETFKASGNETEYTLSYDGNVHGAVSAEPPSRALKITATENAAEAMQGKPGYTFVCWNTKPDGKGVTYEENELVKPAGKAPTENIVLYAIWSDNSLDFENKTIELPTSMNAQYESIKEASGGSGEYEYSVLNNKEYFSISDNSQVVVSAEAPAGKYAVTIKAFDTKTSAEATAVYKFTLTRIAASLTLSSSEATVLTHEDNTITYNKVTNGAVSVESDNPLIATAVVSSDSKIVITSKDVTGNATITVKTAETGVYEATSAACVVTVKNRTFKITPINVTADANGTPHSAKVKSTFPDIELTYGVDGKYNHVLHIVSADTPYELVDESRTEISETTINYRATKLGYDDEYGTVTLKIEDNDLPTGKISAQTKALTNTQTVTIEATDTDKIIGYYFGQDASGSPNSIEHVRNFKREKVAVASGEGMYYLIVEDTGHHVHIVDSMMFYMTEFDVDDGETAQGPVLIASGDSFALPTITPDEGYLDPGKWTVPYTAAEISSGANYAPTQTDTLKASCIEMQATYSYSANGHDNVVTTAEATVAKFNDEVTAAATPVVVGETGYSFVCWNTKPNGTGTTYMPEDTVKESGEVPVDTVLYAIWSNNALVFNNQTIDPFKASENAQYVDIVEASSGSGSYRYEVMNNKDYFSISGDSQIVVSAEAPAGKYTVTVKAIDKVTEVEALAVYSFELTKRTASLTLASEDATMYTQSTLTIDYSKVTNGAVSVETDNPSVATAVVSGDSEIIITSKDITGDAVFTVKAAETGIYNSTNKTIALKVINKDFKITPLDEVATADGTPHYARVKSSLSNVEIHYGLDPNHLGHILYDVPEGEPVVLSAEPQTEIGEKTIYYRAIRPGYADVTGFVMLTVTDNDKPIGTISNWTSENADHQTVTLTASDTDKVIGFYFGQDASGTPKPLASPVKNFRREKVDVASGEGTYYFIVEDTGHHIETVDTRDFFMTRFEVTNGTTKQGPVLIAESDGFNLPTFQADTGYNITGLKWKLSSDGTELSAGAFYSPAGTDTFKVSCNENTATLTYNGNVSSDAPIPSAEPMKFTATAEAAPAIKGIDGYTFSCWNTEPDGTGETYLPGEVVKAAFKEPVDTTLYAIWSSNDIKFNNYNLGYNEIFNTSENAQYIDLEGASGGSGHYTYSVLNNDEYFSISANSQLRIKEGTPAGQYTVTVKALDNVTGKYATAVYKLKLTKLTAKLSFVNPETVQIATGQTKEIPFTKVTNGTVYAESTNSSVVSVVGISENNIIVESHNEQDEVDIILKAVATDVYTEATEISIKVRVKPQEFNLYCDNENFDLNDGKVHALEMYASIDDVTVYYGTNPEELDNVITVGTTPVKLTGVTMEGEGQTTVYYKASRPGYADKEDHKDIEVWDYSEPEINYATTNNLSSKQTITMTITDKATGINRYYWGTKDNAKKSEYTPLDDVRKTLTIEKEVEEAGTYYLYYYDGYDDKNTDCYLEVTFNKTTLSTNHCTSTYDYIITENGKSFELPEITPEEGFLGTNEWKLDEAIYHVGDTYDVMHDTTLTATCSEDTSTLSYDGNGHGITSADSQTMTYSGVTKAAAAISGESGYEFVAWNTKPDGSGKTFDPDETVKAAGEALPDTTLYAIWKPIGIAFASKTFEEFETSENAQYKDITVATGGSNNFKYEVLNNKEYFSVVSGESRIAISAEAPAGKYAVTVKATDTVNGESATAVYRFTLTKMAASLTLTSSEANISTNDYAEIGFTKHTNGGVTVETNNPLLVAATVSGDSNIALTSKNAIGTATITVTAAATDIYDEVSKACEVTVNNRQITITPINVTASADGMEHAAKVTSDVDGVELRYGLSADKLNHILNIESKDVEVALSAESRTNADEITIFYRASKAGYDDKEGSVTLKVVDYDAPTGFISEATKNLTDKQTVTLTASDNGKVTAYYFGKEQDGELIPLDEPVKNFKLEKVAVASGNGTYYFIVKDNADHTERVDTLEFYNTKFVVTHGATSLDTVLLASGGSFTLPAITAATGYIAPNEWTVSGEARKISAEAEYAPTSTEILTAECDIVTATLSYNGNGHAITTADSQSMSFITEITAAAGLTGETGFTFASWNTKADGSGKTYMPGDTVKSANKAAENMTLYAIWSESEFTFENQKFLGLYASNDAQTVDFVEATGGSGHFSYEVMNNTDHFSLSGDSHVIIAANTPAGKYNVSIKASDTKSSTGASVTAVYKFELAKRTASLELAKNSVDMKTLSAESINLDRVTDGDISVKSNNPAVAKAEISGDSVKIITDVTTGDATITVEAEETDIYGAISKEITVSVTEQEFHIFALCDYFVLGDGKLHAITISSDADDVLVYYGVNEDNLDCTKVIGRETTSLDGVTMEDEDEIEVYYRATKPGYKDVVGSELLEVGSEGTKPKITSYSVTNNVANKQTVTFTAREGIFGIKGYYWGDNNNPGAGDHINVDMADEITLDIEVSSGGTYYLSVLNGATSGSLTKRRSDVLSFTFYKTNLEVTNGTTTTDYVLTEANEGKSFNLPAITPDPGYNGTNIWKVNETSIECTAGAKYEVTGETTLTATCEQKTAKLSYNANGHNVATADAQDMYFESDTVINAEPLSDQGYAFKCWNTESDGSGRSYKTGDKFRDAKDVDSIKNTILYAIWTKNDLEFNSQSYLDLHASLDAQSVNIVSADAGTGDYTYTIPAGGQTNDEYFSISDNSKILIKAGTPAGEYTVTVQAEDNNSGVTAKAVYTIKLSKIDASLELSANTVSMKTSETKSVNFSKTTNGVVSATTTNPAVAEVAVENGYLEITSKDVTGNATINVVTAATGVYKETSASCTVTVSNRTMVITPISACAEANGTGHFAKIKADKPGVTLYYGTEGKYDHVVTLETSGQTYNMSEVVRMVKGVTTVNYKAVMSGYDDVYGTTTITITDETAPTGSITDITNNTTATQTVTLNASDYDEIAVYYFGTDASAEPTIEVNAQTLKVKNVEVTADATYYLIVQDKSGNKATVAEKEFYRTTFTVEHGSPAYSSVLTAAGSKFALPTMTPNTGYTAGTKWVVSGDAETVKGNAGNDYTPAESLELVGICSDIEATLTYYNNGHGTEPSPVTMKYSVETTAAAALSADGYEFKGWSTRPSGMGEKFNAGNTVKAAGVIPEDMDLYAIWEQIPLVFDNQTLFRATSSNAQLIDITAPLNGSGNYEYAIESQNGDCLSISGDSLILAANTPAGKYIATIVATDKTTNITAKATYSVTVSRIANTLTLDKTSISMGVSATEKVGLKTSSDGDVTVTSNKPSIVGAEYEDGQVVLTSTESTGNATITVSVAKTDVYNDAEATIDVTVERKTITITEEPTTEELDGKSHSARIRSSVDDILFRYGTNQHNLNHILNNVVKDQVMTLSADGRVETGTSTIYYEASKDGYETATGSVTVKVLDTTAPEFIPLEISRSAAAKQKLYFKTSDLSEIVAYYVGTSAEPAPGDFVPVDSEKNYQGSCDLEEKGKYYCAAMDKEGNVTEIDASMPMFEMVEVSFVVTHGTPSIAKILAGKDSFATATATISADSGYVAPSKWQFSNGTTVDCGASIEFAADTTLTAVCEEKTATLTYNANGHGTAPAEVKMTYTQVTKAADGLASADGYEFKGWKDNISGITYQPGQTVKAENTVPTDMTLYAVWEKIEEEEPEVPEDITNEKIGQSLTIGDELSVNFYFKVPEKYKDATVTFKVGKDDSKMVDGVKDSQYPDYTKFVCKINVNQMSDTIKWTYKRGEKSYSGTYSFYKYLIDQTKDGKTGKLAEFCNKLKAYGYYAQNFLSKSRGFVIGEKYAKIPEPPAAPGEHAEDLKQFKTELSASGTNISSDANITRSLVLDSSITLIINVPMTDTCEWTEDSLPTIKATRDGIEQSVSATIQDDKLSIEIKGIKISYLGKNYTITIGDEATIKASAMTYAERLINTTATSEWDKPFANALYELYDIAQKYTSK